ncbi:MAG TPA: nucleotidyltransferase domain-containing protein [Armatimonadota bacterium]|nr:nucleotidyltransferase domain-containing protein [Armatimonadota bacterium]
MVSAMDPAPARRAPDQYIIDELAPRTTAAVRPLRIILFGSAALGTMSPDSDLDDLVSGLRQQGATIPAEVDSAVVLTGFAWESRYPGSAEPVTEEEHQEALRHAEVVVARAGAARAEGERAVGRGYARPLRVVRKGGTVRLAPRLFFRVAHA